MPSFTATWIACAVQAPVSRYITLSPPGSEDDSAVAGLPGRVDRADQRQRRDPRSLLGQAVSRGSPTRNRYALSLTSENTGRQRVWAMRISWTDYLRLL